MPEYHFNPNQVKGKTRLASVLGEPYSCTCRFEMSFVSKLIGPLLVLLTCILLGRWSLPLIECRSCPDLTKFFCLGPISLTPAQHGADSVAPKTSTVLWVTLHHPAEHRPTTALSRCRVCRCLEWSPLIPAGAIADVSSSYQMFAAFHDQCARRWPPQQEETALLDRQPSPRPRSSRASQFDEHNAPRDGE